MSDEDEDMAFYDLYLYDDTLPASLQPPAPSPGLSHSENVDLFDPRGIRSISAPLPPTPRNCGTPNSTAPRSENYADFVCLSCKYW